MKLNVNIHEKKFKLNFLKAKIKYINMIYYLSVTTKLLIFS